MDEKNGQIFNHHAELFTQIGTVPDIEPLRDFMLESAGMMQQGGSAKNPLPHPQTAAQSQESIWTHGYNCNEAVANCGRNAYGLPQPVDTVDLGNTNALLDSLVKSMPPTEAVLDQYVSKNAEVNHVPNPLFGLHRISTDKVTQDFLDNLNKLEPEVGLGKCEGYESLSWNGVICDLNFQTQNRLGSSSVDKNGNSALFDASHGEKIAEPFPQNNFRLSPSASVETNVRTPATSLESASPLSSNRTPIRSDESISPMGSGHTPLRVEESTSPLASIKTPLRMEEGSPMGRTPLRVEESFSPAGTSSGLTPSPSHKANGQQGFENYNSPPSIFKKMETKSPTPSVLPSPVRGVETEDVRTCPESKTEDKDTAGSSSPRMEASVDAVNKRQKIPIPFVSAKRIDDSLVSKKSTKRTLPKTDDVESGSSSSLAKAEREPAAVCGIKTETKVPEDKNDNDDDDDDDDDDEDYDDDAQRLAEKAASDAFSEEMFSKSKRRRRRSDNLCLPSIKRRSRKRVTIYQSSMSLEETGIKLKIKLAPMRPTKKRRSRKSYGSDDEEEGSGSKKCKKIVRFSGGREPERVEQTEWGNKIPPGVLQKIFQFVVDEQGCVPSLVRFSSVCKLWNSVANRPELWQNIDLSSPYIKQKCKIDRYFRWLLENRLGNMKDLNLNGWKFSNITMVLSLICTHCTEIESIGLAGWQGLHYEHLKALLQDCPLLSKFDLSDVSPESKSANSAVSQKSITFLTQTMGERLTQLILAHNTLTCLPQIISSLATHCPNLQVLDLSNIRRVSHTEFALNIEHLQEGCQKLRVLRITNSCVTLANVPLEKQVASPGFTNLEELSIAGHQGTESLRITSVMDDNCLERILKTSHKLKLLDVRGCTRITDSSLVRVPAWDIQHLFLSGCYVTRQCGSGLELIAQKWCHSLVEIDLAWTTVTDDLNAAIMAFAEKGAESPLRVMNLCGSSVTLEPVKALLSKCRNLESLNLQSCRGLPRGVKRLYENEQVAELRSMLEKKDRDSGSEGEDKRDADGDSRTRESPLYSTNYKDDDLVT